MIKNKSGESKESKRPRFLKTDSGQVIPIKVIKETVCAYRCILQSKPPKSIRIRKKNSHKLVF
jgi:hypothetical protein